MIKIVSKKKWDEQIYAIEMEMSWIKSKIKVAKSFLERDAELVELKDDAVQTRNRIECNAQLPVLESNLLFLERQLDWFKS